MKLNGEINKGQRQSKKAECTTRLRQRIKSMLEKAQHKKQNKQNFNLLSFPTIEKENAHQRALYNLQTKIDSNFTKLFHKINDVNDSVLNLEHYMTIMLQKINQNQENQQKFKSKFQFLENRYQLIKKSTSISQSKAQYHKQQNNDKQCM